MCLLRLALRFPFGGGAGVLFGTAPGFRLALLRFPFGGGAGFCLGLRSC
jgi:hypothetical protein